MECKIKALSKFFHNHIESWVCVYNYEDFEIIYDMTQRDAKKYKLPINNLLLVRDKHQQVYLFENYRVLTFHAAGIAVVIWKPISEKKIIEYFGAKDEYEIKVTFDQGNLIWNQ